MPSIIIIKKKLNWKLELLLSSKELAAKGKGPLINLRNVG
jgi:hypothetical protein